MNNHSRQLKIRKTSAAKGTQDQYSLNVPSRIATLVPDNIRFVPELTEDGILYRPTKMVDESIEIPSWLSDL